MEGLTKHQIKIKELFDKNELNRLERAVKDKDKTKITDWARQFENQLIDRYEKAFNDELSLAIDNFVLTIVYTLHFNEKTKFGSGRIKDFMEDLFATIDLFTTEEYTAEEYKKILEKDGIIINRR